VLKGAWITTDINILSLITLPQTEDFAVFWLFVMPHTLLVIVQPSRVIDDVEHLICMPHEHLRGDALHTSLLPNIFVILYHYIGAKTI